MCVRLWVYTYIVRLRALACVFYSWIILRDLQCQVNVSKKCFIYISVQVYNNTMPNTNLLFKLIFGISRLVSVEEI